MTYQEYLENTPKERVNKLLKHVSCELYKLKNPTVDQQTIYFWHLQLQFFTMKERDLLFMYAGIFPRNSVATKSDKDIATELALYLSGIDQ